MDKRKRKALEAAGWVFEDAEDFSNSRPKRDAWLNCELQSVMISVLVASSNT